MFHNRKTPLEIFVFGFIAVVFILVVSIIVYGVTIGNEIDPECFIYQCIKIK